MYSMRGGIYEGFLKENKNGNIVGATFDCFADHTRNELDFLVRQGPRNTPEEPRFNINLVKQLGVDLAHSPHGAGKA